MLLFRGAILMHLYMYRRVEENHCWSEILLYGQFRPSLQMN